MNIQHKIFLVGTILLLASIIPYIFLFEGSLIPDEETSDDADEDVVLTDESGEPVFPQNEFTFVDGITFLSGENVSSNELDDLKQIDDNSYDIEGENTGSEYEFNIIFEISKLEGVIIDFADVFLYFKAEVTGSPEEIYLQGMQNYTWRNLTIISNHELNINKYYIENTTKFRVFGSTIYQKQVFIDRFLVLVGHENYKRLKNLEYDTMVSMTYSGEARDFQWNGTHWAFLTYDTKKVLLYDENFNYIKEFDVAPGIPGFMPSSLCFDGEYWHVLDIGTGYGSNWRVYIFDSSFSYTSNYYEVNTGGGFLYLTFHDGLIYFSRAFNFGIFDVYYPNGTYHGQVGEKSYASDYPYIDCAPTIEYYEGNWYTVHDGHYFYALPETLDGIYYLNRTYDIEPTIIGGWNPMRIRGDKMYLLQPNIRNIYILDLVDYGKRLPCPKIQSIELIPDPIAAEEFNIKSTVLWDDFDRYKESPYPFSIYYYVKHRASNWNTGWQSMSRTSSLDNVWVYEATLYGLDLIKNGTYDVWIKAYRTEKLISYQYIHLDTSAVPEGYLLNITDVVYVEGSSNSPENELENLVYEDDVTYDVKGDYSTSTTKYEFDIRFTFGAQPTIYHIGYYDLHLYFKTELTSTSEPIYFQYYENYEWKTIATITNAPVTLDEILVHDTTQFRIYGSTTIQKELSIDQLRFYMVHNTPFSKRDSWDYMGLSNTINSNDVFFDGSSYFVVRQHSTLPDACVVEEYTTNWALINTFDLSSSIPEVYPTDPLIVHTQKSIFFQDNEFGDDYWYILDHVYKYWSSDPAWGPDWIRCDVYKLSTSWNVLDKYTLPQTTNPNQAWVYEGIYWDGDYWWVAFSQHPWPFNPYTDDSFIQKFDSDWNFVSEVPHGGSINQIQDIDFDGTYWYTIDVDGDFYRWESDWTSRSNIVRLTTEPLTNMGVSRGMCFDGDQVLR